MCVWSLRGVSGSFEWKKWVLDSMGEDLVSNSEKTEHVSWQLESRNFCSS